MIVGKIIVRIYDEAVQEQAPPPEYEFGLSTDRMTAPTVAQDSNEFLNLSDGTYYIWFREKGTPWLIKQVLKEFVDTNTSAPTQYVTYQKNADSVLLFTQDGTEIRTKLSITRLIVDSLGQTQFVLPVEAQVGITALLINAERYYEGTGYTLTENNTKIIWQGLFTIDIDDVVAVEYIVSLLM